MAFTVPMRLMEEVDPEFTKVPPKGDPATGQETSNLVNEQPRLSGVIDPEGDSKDTHPKDGNEATHLHPTKGGLVTVTRNVSASASINSASQELDGRVVAKGKSVELPAFKIVSLVSFYPSCDYTLSREKRAKTLSRKDMELSPVFTSLFDAAYFSPTNLDRSNPYVSPGVAGEELLKHGLPEYIQIYTCEWDMLRAEALALRDRLRKLGKQVHHEDVKGVPHGWDKSPNPFKEALGARKHYNIACKQLHVADCMTDIAGVAPA